MEEKKGMRVSFERRTTYVCINEKKRIINRKRVNERNRMKGEYSRELYHVRVCVGRRGIFHRNLNFELLSNICVLIGNANTMTKKRMELFKRIRHRNPFADRVKNTTR